MDEILGPSGVLSSSTYSSIYWPDLQIRMGNVFLKAKIKVNRDRYNMVDAPSGS